MRKLIYILSFIPLLLVGCSNDADDKQIDPPTLRVSQWNVYFPSQGGTCDIVIATNMEEWEVENNNQWLEHEKSQNAIRLVAEPNETGNIVSGLIRITGTRGVETVRDSLFVRQSAVEGTSLSSGGTSNCYVVRTNSDYKFDATVRGNGQIGVPEADSGTARYVQEHGVKIEDAVYAELLWETRIDGIETKEIISGTPYFADGMIYFSTGKSTGNAVIAVKNATGNILWSWHIWVIEQEIKTVAGNGFMWMDRNLGAENNVPENTNNRGLHYQWGRKDPFPPSTASLDDPGPYEHDNIAVGKGTGAWDYHQTTAPSINTGTGNLNYTVMYPMRLINSTNDWYMIGNSTDQEDSFLWGNRNMDSSKTMFDPCPPGYVVPPAGSFWELGAETPISSEWDSHEHYGVIWKDNGEFFPFTGLRQAHEYSTATNLTNGFAMYWTQTPSYGDELNNSWRLIAEGWWTSYDNLLNRTYGLAIRCVKEYQ